MLAYFLMSCLFSHAYLSMAVCVIVDQLASFLSATLQTFKLAEIDCTFI